MQKQTSMLFPYLLVFYEIANYLANDAYLPGLPHISHELQTTNDMALYTFTAFFIGGALVQFFLGPLSDRFGRRPVLLGGGLVFIASTVACAMAPGIHALILARFFQGMAVPSMIIPGYAAINEHFSGEMVIKILARMAGVTILAPAFGPLLGGVILTFFSWRVIFVVLAIWAAVGLLLLFWKMPETLRPENTHEFHPIAILKNYQGLVSNRVFMGNLFSLCLCIGTLMCWMIGGPFLIMQKFRLSTLYFGLFQTLIFGAFIIGTKLLAWFVTDENKGRFVSLGFAIALLGVCCQIAIAMIAPNALFSLIAPMIIIGLGIGLCFPTLNRLTIESSDAPMGQRVAVSSTTQMAFAALYTSIYGATHTGTLFYMGLFNLACVLLAICMRGIAAKR